MARFDENINFCHSATPLWLFLGRQRQAGAALGGSSQQQCNSSQMNPERKTRRDEKGERVRELWGILFVVCHRKMTKSLSFLHYYLQTGGSQECNELPCQQVKRRGHCDLQYPMARRDTHTMLAARTQQECYQQVNCPLQPFWYFHLLVHLISREGNKIKAKCFKIFLKTTFLIP